MQKKFRYLVLFILAVALLTPAVFPALALETTFPEIAGQRIDSQSNLLNYLQYFFMFALAIAGIAAVISITISGLQILLFAGSAEKISEAKEHIWGAVLGIALLLVSFILIRTINPTLINPSLTSLPTQANGSVTLETTYTTLMTGDQPQTLPITINGVEIAQPIVIINAPQSDSNTGVLPDARTINNQTMPTGTSLQGSSAIRKIRYTCTPPTGTIGPRLLLWRYGTTNFQIDRVANRSGAPRSGGAYAEVSTFALPCNADANNSYQIWDNGSYKWAIETPGVYFSLEPCTNGTTWKGILSDIYTNNAAIQPFDCQVINGQITSPCVGWPNGEQAPKSVWAVNSAQAQYGLILNAQQPLPIGECSKPIINDYLNGNGTSTTGHCFNLGNPGENISFTPKYAYVFQHTTAQDTQKIQFESNNLYARIGSGDFTLWGGRGYRLPDIYGGDLNNWLRLPDNADPVAERGHGALLNLERNARPFECREEETTSCLNRITRYGGYYRVILYGEDGVTFDNKSCQVYTQQQDNFNEGNNNRWIFDGNNKSYDMYVIPMPRPAGQ